MWSSKSLGSKFRYGFFQALIRLKLARIGRFLIFPIPVYYALRSKAKAMPYLKRRFPEASSLRQFWMVFRLYYNFANVLFDRMIIANGGTVPLAHDEASIRVLEKALEKGNGAVLVSAHFGSWQTGLMALESLGCHIAVVFWQEESLEHDFFRYEKDVEIISACGGVKSALQMLRVLKQNGILCFMGDRMTPGDRKSATVSFLGGKITIPVFPYLLAKAASSQVVFTASVRKGGVITGLPAIHCENLDVAPGMFVNFLERLIGSYPLDFFNFYDMWAENEQGTNNR